MSFTIYTKATNDDPSYPLYEAPDANTLYDAVISAIENDVDLIEANLDNLTLFGPLHNLKADKSSLKNFNSRGQPIAGCSFRVAHLSGNFSGSHIHHCDMTLATISGDMTVGKLEHLNLCSAVVIDLDMTGSVQNQLKLFNCYVNGESSSLRGLLPEIHPFVHREMLRNSIEFSLSDKFRHRMIVEIPITTKYGDCTAMVDLRLNELGDKSPLDTSPAAQSAIAKAIGQEIVPGQRLDINLLAKVGLSFISTNKGLEQEFKNLRSLFFQQNALTESAGIQILTPLRNDNTLSTQLSMLSGDGYSAVRFKAAMESDGSSDVRSAGLIEHVESKQRFYIPLAALTSRDQLPGWEISKLVNLLQNGGRGGFDWGNTPGRDGGFGQECLEQMVDAGLIKRTGREVPNQLGGGWPEVQLTPAGAASAMMLNIKKNAGELPWFGVPLPEPKEKNVENRPKPNQR